MLELANMNRAWFRAYISNGGNELALDAKPNTHDPTKFRQGTFDAGNYFGAFSGDFLVGDPANPTRYEKILVGFKPDDDAHARPSIAQGLPGGAIDIFCQTPGRVDDAGMVRSLRLTSRYVELFGHKLATRNADGTITWHVGAGVAAGRQYHEGGQFVTVYQNDGHVVEYDMRTTPWTPLWSNWTGLLKPLPW